jgi:hypothetical protein
MPFFKFLSLRHHGPPWLIHHFLNYTSQSGIYVLCYVDTCYFIWKITKSKEPFFVHDAPSYYIYIYIYMQNKLKRSTFLMTSFLLHNYACTCLRKSSNPSAWYTENAICTNSTATYDFPQERIISHCVCERERLMKLLYGHHRAECFCYSWLISCRSS